LISLLLARGTTDIPAVDAELEAVTAGGEGDDLACMNHADPTGRACGHTVLEPPVGRRQTLDQVSNPGLRVMATIIDPAMVNTARAV
jgi:hypothetical protein